MTGNEHKGAELKRIGPGWLAKSIEAANRWYAANKEYADAIRANWIDHDRPARALQAQQETSDEDE